MQNKALTRIGLQLLGGKKEIIFHQGDETHDFYLIRNGKVRVFCSSPSGNETSIRVVSANEMIGEFAPIDG